MNTAISPTSGFVYRYLSEQERKRRERRRHSPNLIWFHRCVRNKDVTAEICLVNNKYRWRVFGVTGIRPLAEGFSKSVTRAQRCALSSFRWLELTCDI